MPRSTLNDSLRLELMDDVPVARLQSTERVFDRAVESIARLIRETVVKGLPHLLLDVRDAAFDSPSVVDRMRMVRQCGRRPPMADCGSSSWRGRSSSIPNDSASWLPPTSA